MAFRWKDTVPGDHYCVRLSKPIGPMELAYVTHLYQPLTGSHSVSLYVTLYHERMIASFEAQYGTHRGLMSIMNMPLDRIIKARECLEAVGLLRTIKVETEHGNSHYEYILQPPMDPSTFFGDDMMSIILLNRVGKAKYRYLREKFVGSDSKQSEENEIRTEMTKSFDEVFYSISPSELVVPPGSETSQFLTEMDELYPVRKRTAIREESSSSLSFSIVEPDFAFLEASLPKSIGESRALSPQIREIIKELAFFYLLDDFQLSYFLQDPFIYDEKNQICPERLRKLVKDWYQKQHQGQVPNLDVIPSPKDSGMPQDDRPKSREEAHRQALSRLSPIALLEQYQGGSKVSPADVKIVEELAQNYHLPSGVINVLLEYVMLTNDKKLPRSLIFKIATHWKRLGIQTVDEALEQAKRLYQEMKAKGKSQTEGGTKGAFSKKNRSLTKREGLPDWVAKQIEQSGNGQEGSMELDEEKKRQAMELLRALGEIE